MKKETAVVEDYLRVIYKLELKEGEVTTNMLANAINVSSASASDMLKKLAAKKLIAYKPYYGATLTQSGLKLALAITRVHRLWEMFLVEKMNFRWDEVHILADELEHCTPLHLENRLDEVLGYPTTDPHGDPIPRSDGEVHDAPVHSLAEIAINKPTFIRRVSDDSPEILQYLAKIGLQLGQRIIVKEIIRFDGSLRVELEGKSLFISSKLSRCIFVVPTDSDE